MDILNVEQKETLGREEVAARLHKLADMLPHGEAFVIPKRNHMLATGDPKFKAAVIKFLLAH